MLGRIRITVLIVSALLFGAAQAACACAPYQGAVSSAMMADHNDAAVHSHHGQTAHNTDHDVALSHDCGDEDEGCGFHSVHELAADFVAPTILTAPTQIASLAIVPDAPVLPAPRFETAGGASLLSQPPPRSTPVSLKVRLLN